MPSLIDIRRRIRSVKNTQQITKALKMVSAAKLRRAQDRVLAARPYAQVMQRMLENIAAAASEDTEIANNPLLARRPEERILLLVVTADTGKAGAFNSSVIKSAQRFISEHRGAEVSLELMGRKGRDFFHRRYSHIAGEHIGIFQRTVKREDSLAIARKVTEMYARAEVDAVYMIVNEFKSVVSPELRTRPVLPVEMPKTITHTDYLFEQPPAELLGSLLPRYVEVQIYRAMLESSAAEHAARMTAMDAASSNASDIIDRLTLTMNRVRQAKITREIIEIVSGAAALE